MKNGPYELVKAPPEYPGKKYRGRYVYEHHLIYWRKTGRLVPPGFVLHHKDEKKRHNKLRNLELRTRKEHSHYHAKPTTMITLVCSWCHSKFVRTAQRCRSKLGKQERFYCCRSHQVKDQWKRRKFIGL